MADKKTVLTLNLGSQRVGMAKFSIGGKGALVLREYAFSDMPGDPTTEGTRANALYAPVGSLAAGFKAAESDVNYAIPGHVLMTKFVKLPPLAEDQVEKIVGFEAQQAVPFPLTETVWDYQLMGKHAGEVEVGIVAVRSEQSNEFNGPVASAKLSPHIVDAAPVALYNAFRYNYPQADGCNLLVDLGARTTNLIFIEGARAFVSTVQVGSATLTQAIAKETNLDFDSAEQAKVANGFVNLGGNYADHDDPEIDAMSKVLRNALTRLHGEVTRRINLYRQQQGGSAPTAVYLAGGGASLPYMKEYWEEKLRLPVHYFDALTAVGLGPKVNPEHVVGERHMLGELVGLALREMACPMELNLAPQSVKDAKDVSRRKPVLLTAAAALAAGLGSLWAYNSSAASQYTKAATAVESQVSALSRFDSRISASASKQEIEEARIGHLKEAIVSQKYMTDMLSAINQAFPNDEIWLTQVSPVSLDKGESPLAPLYTESGDDMENNLQETLNKLSPSFGTGAVTASNKGKNQKVTIGALHLKGIVKAKSEKDSQSIDQLWAKLTGKDEKSPIFKEYFSFDPSLQEGDLARYYRNVNTTEANDKDGISFEMVLPLKRPIDVTPL